MEKEKDSINENVNKEHEHHNKKDEHKEHHKEHEHHNKKDEHKEYHKEHEHHNKKDEHKENHKEHEHHNKKDEHHYSINKTHLFTFATIILGILLILSLATNGFSNLNFSKNNNLDQKLIDNENSLDAFAKCLTDEGAIFYGTEWCGFCNQQKQQFKDSIEHINFIDCDLEKELCINEGITGYPTWKINGQAYSGVQSLEVLAQITGCEYVPVISAGNEINLIILNDKRCEDCALIKASVLDTTENNIFPNTNFDVEEYDYNTIKGKEIFDKYNLQKLPAFIFDLEIENEEGYNAVAGALSKLNDDKYLILPDAMSANFDPTKEICDNGIDDTENGLIDCEDPDCKNTLECNPNAFVECAAEFGVSADSIVFYYSDTCPWCNMMKPGIEQLENEGYNFVWSDSTNAEDNIMINQCFSNYMSGGVPQFICLKKNDIKVGAFATSNQELDLNAMKTWVDNCLA